MDTTLCFMLRSLLNIIYFMNALNFSHISLILTESIFYQRESLSKLNDLEMPLLRYGFVHVCLFP